MALSGSKVDDIFYSLYRLRLLFLMLFGISMVMPRITTAQDSGFIDFHTWSDLTTIYNFSESFRYDGDYGIRVILALMTTSSG